MNPADVERRRLEREAVKAAWTCSQCGEQRPHQARGLCARCHHALWTSENREHVKAKSEEQRRARGMAPMRRLTDEEREERRDSSCPAGGEVPRRPRTGPRTRPAMACR